MVSPTESNLPGLEEDFLDNISPRPIDELLGSRDMPPPPMIQIAPLAFNSMWDSEMMTKYTDDAQAKRSGTAANVDRSGLIIMPPRR